MNTIATQEQFDSAPVGHPFMEACRRCTSATGNLLIKDRGKPNKGNGFTLPTYACGEHSVCEFCQFLDVFMNGESTSPEGEVEESPEPGSYGAAKIVIKGDGGAYELLAYVPFRGGEENEINVNGTDIKLRHGMIIEAEPNGEEFKLQQVVERGVIKTIIYEEKV